MSTKVLVVDDEPNLQPLVQQIFAKQIRNQLYEFIFALDGQQALSCVKQNPDVEVILTDISMPKMDGLTLLANLQQHRLDVNPMLTVVMVSAYDDMNNIRQAMNGGAFDFITKPVTPPDLRITLEKSINHVEQLKEAQQKQRAAEEALRQMNEELERRVQERTAELLKANQALQAANEELDAFARTVAHELKSSLSNVIGFTEFLTRQPERLSLEEIVDIGRSANWSAYKAVHIVDELLLLSKLRQDEVPRETVSTAALVHQVKRRFTPLIEETQATICQPHSWPAAVGYAPWVEEVWANYISNGLKYGGQPPCLSLGATPDGNGFVKFWVKDNGNGIPIDEQSQIFSEYTRPTKLRIHGEGLGLSIVRRIVEKLGGQVGVESSGVAGEGCLFYFTLPSAEAEETLDAI